MAGYATIGYGHLIKPGEKFLSAISEEQAEEILRADLVPAEQAVNELVKVALTQSQFDALVSFTFNEGQGHLRASSLLEKLNKGDYSAVPNELAKWTWAGGKSVPGLVMRREAEAQLWAA